MLEQIILGITQGIVEWLPVSSEGAIVLIKTNIFNAPPDYEALIKHALFLHLGTFLAALIYFRKDVGILLKCIVSFNSQDQETKKLFNFLLFTTIISGIIGIILLKTIVNLTDHFEATGKSITLVIGFLLIGTGLLELKASRPGYRNLAHLKWHDTVITGLAQGLASLPGFSRSGLTMSTLLLLKFDKQHALKLSFLLSLPIVLAGNIVLNLDLFVFSLPSLIGLLCSFIFGLMTIHLLLKLAQAVNFGYFMLIFGSITILSFFI